MCTIYREFSFKSIESYLNCGKFSQSTSEKENGLDGEPGAAVVGGVLYFVRGQHLVLVHLKILEIRTSKVIKVILV